MNSDKRVVCPICNGSGGVLEETYTKFGNDVSDAPCPSCNGSGYVSKVAADEINCAIQRTKQEQLEREQKFAHEEIPF